MSKVNDWLDNNLFFRYFVIISGMIVSSIGINQFLTPAGCLTVNQFYIKIYCFLQKSVNFYLHFLYVYCNIYNFVLPLKYRGEL